MKPIELRESDFKREVWLYKFPEAIKQEFFDYWTEPNKSGTKMRYELEKTWHLGRRLARWANNSKTVAGKPAPPTTKPKMPETDIEKLDALLSVYRKNPTGVPFDSLAQYYPVIKEMRLWPNTLTKGKMEEIRELYSGNETKCRAWVVERTLMWYENNGWMFSDTLKVRQ